MPELLGDDPDIDALGPQLGGVSVPESVCMYPLGDPGLVSQTGEEHANVAILEELAVEQAKNRFSPVDAMGGPDLKPFT